MEHSFSASYFRQKFRSESLPFRYDNFELPDLDASVPELKADPSIRGLNVTIPYKKAIMPYLDDISSEARSIGAVNVIRSDGNGHWTGYNTDCFGFERSLLPRLCEKFGKAEDVQALVLGNGGASQAVQYVLARHHIPYYLVSRRKASGFSETFRPEAVMNYAECETAGLAARCRLVVNTTSLGMFPRINTCPLVDYRSIGSSHLAYDIVYNPRETLFLRKCRTSGACCIGGTEMLHLQAQEAWRIWTGKEW